MGRLGPLGGGGRLGSSSWAVLGLGLLLWLWSSQGAAQRRPEEPPVAYSRLWLRVSLGGGMLISEDQTRWLGYDGAGLLADTTLAFRWLSWLAPRLSLAGGAFPATEGGAGGLLAPLLGVAAGSFGPSQRLYGFVDVGPALTGDLVRAWVRAGVGADFRVSTAFTVGPVLGYGQISQTNGPHDSSDARFVYLAISGTFRSATIACPPRCHLDPDGPG